MELDFHDRPVENELDRMFDYDVDGFLSPLEQSYKLDYMTGDIEDDRYDYESDFDSDDDDYGFCPVNKAEQRRHEESMRILRETHQRSENRKLLILGGIIFISSIVFASSPGIVLFIIAMLFSAKISKMF